MGFMPRKKKYGKGFALTELLIAVAVIGVIAIFVMDKMNATTDKRLVQQEVENVTQLSAGIKNLFGATGAANFTGLTNAVALNSNAVPNNMRNGVNIRNQWIPNGVTLGVAGGGAQYTVTSVGIPQQFCTEISSLTMNMFTTTTVNGAAVTTPAAAAAACNIAANTIVWTGS